MQQYNANALYLLYDEWMDIILYIIAMITNYEFQFHELIEY